MEPKTSRLDQGAPEPEENPGPQEPTTSSIAAIAAVAAARAA